MSLYQKFSAKKQTKQNCICLAISLTVLHEIKLLV